MADKKVDRYSPQRALDPSRTAKSALSSEGTIDMADPTHDKGKSALVDKFRDREARWRREQSIHDREAASGEGRVSRRPAGKPPIPGVEVPDEGGAG